MSATVLIALALHGGIAMWFALPASEHRPEIPEQTLRVSLLAAVAETTTATPAVTPPPQQNPVSKPPITPPPKPEIVPPPKPQPVVTPTPKSEPEPEPKIEPEPELLKNIPTPVEAPNPNPETTQPPQTEPNTVPLDAVATARYEQLFIAWLEKHKNYPRRAKRLRIEGEGMLRILIDRTGQTQLVILEQRTGNRLLDKAALEMAQRADPFPPLPENDPRQQLEFMVPVVFALR